MAPFDRREACGETDASEFVFRRARFWTPQEIEVCLFLPAEQPGTAADMAEWFEARGFETVFSTDTRQDAGTKAGDLQAFVTFGLTDHPFDPVFGYLLARSVIGRSANVSVIWDDLGLPMGTQLIFK